MKPYFTYNKDAYIAAIGPSVWAKLGPEKWFDNYVIAVDNSRGYNADYVIDLDIRTSNGRALTTQKIIDTQIFADIAQSDLEGYKFLVYKPVTKPTSLNEDRFISNNERLGKYEDKKVFRDIFNGHIQIPRHTIMSLTDFVAIDTDTWYDSTTAQLGTPLVIQDNLNSGGRGTFIVSSKQGLQDAIKVLSHEKVGTHVIVSEFIQAMERSIQICIGRESITVGPLQQQLVRNPELLNPESRGGVFFCGGKLLFNIDTALQAQIDSIVQSVSDVLRADGYKGIFGLDLLVDASGTVNVIEINARTTGILPLLNEQATSLPLYLVHILELLGESYELPQHDAAAIMKPYEELSGPQSFVILFNTTHGPAYLDNSIQTGNYTFQAGALQRIDTQPRWNPQADVMVQCIATKEYPSRPNLKLCNIFLKHTGFDDNGALTDEARTIIDTFKKHVVNKQ